MASAKRAPTNPTPLKSWGRSASPGGLGARRCQVGDPDHGDDREDEGPESDVDLLLVWPDSTDEDTRWDRSMRIAQIVDAVVGKVCIPLIYTDREYEGISPALSTSLQRDGVDLLSSST